MNRGSTLSLAQIPKSLGTFLFWAVVLYVAASLVILIFSAGVYLRTVGDQGPWLTLGGWSMVILYLIVGVGTGIVLGLLSSAHRILDVFESALHAGLSRLPTLMQGSGRDPLSLEEARAHYSTLLDRLLDQTLEYLPLPGWLNRMGRGWIQGVIVADFIALCRERGQTTVPPQEFRNWILGKGATLALLPLHDHLSLWQYALFAVIGLLAAGALWLSYVMG
jgi:hypothetical protein